MTTTPVVPLGRSAASRVSRPRADAAAAKRSATAAPASTSGAPGARRGSGRRRRRGCRPAGAPSQAREPPRPHAAPFSRPPPLRGALARAPPEPEPPARRLIDPGHALRPGERPRRQRKIRVAPLRRAPRPRARARGADRPPRSTRTESSRSASACSSGVERGCGRARAPAAAPVARRGQASTRARPPQRRAARRRRASSTTRSPGETRYDTAGSVRRSACHGARRRRRFRSPRPRTGVDEEQRQLDASELALPAVLPGAA